MQRRFPLLLIAVALTANIGLTAPKKPVKPAAKPAKGSTPSRKTNVHITPITRNSTAAKTEVTLAQNGKALLPIILSDKASAQTKAVATDVADILQRMTNATFEIKVGDGKTGLVLGNAKEFPTPALDEALKIVNGYDGREAYAIRTSKERVLLLGATDLAASHAAYRFLREVGYRHFFPDKAWEIVPDVTTLKFNKDITDRPEILSRDVWFEAGSGSGPANEDYMTWKRRNAHAQSFVSEAGHVLFVVPEMFPEEFKAHPEYYAQTADGQPIKDDLELTNPEVRKLIVE